MANAFRHSTEWADLTVLIALEREHPLAFRLIPLHLITISGLPAEESFVTDSEAFCDSELFNDLRVVDELLV